RELKIEAAKNIAPPIKSFILNMLYSYLKAEKHLPKEYLPESDLSALLKWSKKKLISLIDYLGLYDLAIEIRHIVNPNYLKNIYSCLTPKQQYFLKVCLHQKERLTTPKLGIDPTKQDCDRLKKLVHRRGLARLGKALAGQHMDAVWYLAHTLD